MDSGGELPATLDWDRSARADATLVFCMAVHGVPPIAAALTALGRDPREPALLVERAATPQERIVPGSLGDIANAARDARIESPAVLITGPTVGAATAPIVVARALAPAASAVAV